MIRFILIALAIGGLLQATGCQDLGVGHEGEACNEMGQCRPGLVCDTRDSCVRPGDDGGPDADGGQQDDGDAGQDGADEIDPADGDPVDGDADPGDGDQPPPALTGTWAHAWEAMSGGIYQIPYLKLALTGDGHLIIAGIYDVSFFFEGLDGEPDPNTSTDLYIGKFTSEGALVWGRSFGTQGVQELTALAVDTSGENAMGNYYIGGSFEGTLDFSKYADPDIQDCTADGVDAFVASFTADGALRWRRCWGGPGTQAVTALAVAPNNATVYAAGHFETQLGAEVLTYSGTGLDGFVIGLQTSTGTTNREANLAGPIHVYPAALAMDPYSNGVYLAGRYLGDITEVGGAAACFDFPPANNHHKAFLMKLGSNLDATCLWGIALGDASNYSDTSVEDLLHVGAHDLWLTGGYEGVLQLYGDGVDPAPNLPASRGEDAWLAHFDTDGTLAWWAGYGVDSTQRGLALASAYRIGDPGPAIIYATGLFDKEIDFGAGPMTTPSNEGDAFLAIFDNDDTHVWSRAFGDTLAQEGRDIVASHDGAVFLAGTSTGDVTLADSVTSVYGGRKLIFLVRLDPA